MMSLGNHRLIGRRAPSPGLRNRWVHLPVMFSMLALMLTCLSGCNYLIFFGYLIGGPPQLEPIFEKETNKSFTDRGVQVAVVCSADMELKYQYDSIDHLVAVGVGARLKQNHINVVNPEAVRIWLEENPDWDTADEVGDEFDATYVVYIDISDFALYEHDSRHLFRGRAEAIVSVYEMQADGEGNVIFNHDLSSEFPRLGPRSASEVSYDSFRAEYLLRVSEEIAGCSIRMGQVMTWAAAPDSDLFSSRDLSLQDPPAAVFSPFGLCYINCTTAWAYHLAGRC